LDNDGFDYHFGDGKCEILYNNECVGLAFQKKDLYLLSLCENVNSVCDVNENKKELKMRRRNYGTVVYAIFRGRE
jgi:hypothetical protein